MAKAASSRNWARSRRRRPATAFMALTWAEPPTRRHRVADVDGGADAGVEEVALQEDLAVRDRDDVGRDVGRDVAGLGLDDGDGGQAAPALLVARAWPRARAGGCAGRRRRPGRPRGRAGGAAAARSRGRRRRAWRGRRRRRARAGPCRGSTRRWRSRRRARCRGRARARRRWRQTTMVCSMAPKSSSVFTTCATVERFCPMAT